jgi:hypothetical protein
VGLGLAAASFAVLWAGRASLAALGVGVALLDAGVQSSRLSNQAVVLGLQAEARNRINAVYMVTYFAGGALGTALGALAWSEAGWAGVCGAGGTLAAAGVGALWAVPARAEYSTLAGAARPSRAGG